MPHLSTIKVSLTTQDQLKAVADREGVTLDAVLRMLLRAERQRIMGAELALRESSDEDTSWVASSSSAVARALG
jgi:hypothetical protein